MKINKFISILFLSICLMFLLNSSILPVKAEAGLSEMARTEYYKINDKYAFEILPGGDGGKDQDSIGIVQIEKDNVNITNFYCTNEFKLTNQSHYPSATGLSSTNLLYSYDHYLFHSKEESTYAEAFDLNTGETIYSKTYSRDPFKKEKEILDMLETKLPESTLLNYSNIRNKYQQIFVTDDFSCGFTQFMFVFICLPVFIIAILITSFSGFLAKLILRRFNKK